MEAKCFASKAKPPEEIGVLTLPHKTFAVCTYFGNVHDSQSGNVSTLAE